MWNIFATHNLWHHRKKPHVSLATWDSEKPDDCGVVFFLGGGGGEEEGQLPTFCMKPVMLALVDKNWKIAQFSASKEIHNYEL